MASDSKLASSPVTKEIESRIKQIPEHLFEVFLEIREPTDNEAPEILRKYPTDYSDDILKTAPNFAYPCKIPPDEQSEHFAFVVLDSTGTLFRFGYCRRSNREATCLCIISFYPWFETFYTMLNDLAQIINSKSLNNDPPILIEDVEEFLSSLYNYKLISIDEKKETIEIKSRAKSYSYIRPDTRELPSTLSNRNFAVIFSRLGPEIMLNLFANLLFERRIIFVSSKLFHLTACAYGCLHLIYPMHWQSIFLPILPASMTWTTQCTSPYIIGIHSSVFATLNVSELGDVVIVNIDERKLETEYHDLNSFPKYLTRSMKKGIQHSSQLAGDHLARVFLRAMAFAIGNYASGFIIKNEKLDFDRDLYLEQYLGAHIHTFMSTVAQTQMFEQFSRYRTYLQLQRETDIDEFDLEVKHYQQLQQSKKFKTNKKIYKLLEKYIKDGTIIRENTLARKDLTMLKKRRSLFDTNDDRNKAANPILEQVQNKAGKFHTVINKDGQRVASEASSVRNNLTSLDLNDMMKRTQSSKTIDSYVTNRLSNTLPLHQSNSANVLLENSIPYERFNPNGNNSPFEPKLINGDRDDSSSSGTSRSSTPEPEPELPRISRLISLDNDDDNPLLPSSIVLNVINTPLASPTARQPTQVDSKIKDLQSRLQHQVQTFDGKRLDPRDDCGAQTEIKKLVKQFDPLDELNKFEKHSDDLFSSMPVTFRSHTNSISNMTERHPSVFETIPTNRVTSILQNIQTNYGTTTRFPLRSNHTSPPQQNNLIQFSPPSRSSTISPSLLPKKCPPMSADSSSDFDPLAPSNEKVLYSDLPSKTNGSNLIDF